MNQNKSWQRNRDLHHGRDIRLSATYSRSIKLFNLGLLLPNCLSFKKTQNIIQIISTKQLFIKTNFTRFVCIQTKF